VKQKPSIFAIVTLLVMALALPAFAQKQSPPQGVVITAPLSVVPVDAGIVASIPVVSRTSEVKVLEAGTMESTGLSFQMKKFILELIAISLGALLATLALLEFYRLVESARKYYSNIMTVTEIEAVAGGDPGAKTPGAGAASTGDLAP
jgi:hypothetical protein